MGHFCNPRHLGTCHISVINYITGILGRGCCILKERDIFCHSCLSPTQLLTFGALCRQTNQVSSLCGAVILYSCWLWRASSSSHSLARCPPSFWLKRGFLKEGTRGQNVSASCYRMPNSEEFPAHVTGSQRSDCGDTGLTRRLSHYVPRLDNTELMSCIWVASLAELRAIYWWWYRWEQSTEAPDNLHMLTQLLVCNQ